MKIKKHETPGFQIIRQNEANAKFFVASFDGTPNGQSGSGEKQMNTLTVHNVNSGSSNGWF